MLRLLFILVCIHSFKLFAQKNDSVVNYLKNKANSFLLRDKDLQSFFEINSKGVSIYKSPAEKQKRNPEFFIPLNSLDSCARLIKNWEVFDKVYDSKKFKFYKPYLADSIIKSSVSGVRGKVIVIDPGHISNNLIDAKIEGKYLKFKADSLTEKEVIEGRLTMATAFLLKSKLEAEGATVILTRPDYGKSSFNQSFNEWLQSDSSGYAGKQLTEKEMKSVFLKYNNRDLLNRSEIINKQKPDLTIIIHFNVDEKNVKWEKPTNKNFNMIFVAGAMSRGDLNIRRNRMEFLRLLITDDFEKSLSASETTIKSFEKILNVPTAKPLDADYLTEKSISTPVAGAYCRNLALCRLSHGPLIYGETLYQDNEKEYAVLSVNDFEVNGQKVSKRVVDVAEAYYKGIKEYLELTP